MLQRWCLLPADEMLMVFRILHQSFREDQSVLILNRLEVGHGVRAEMCLQELAVLAGARPIWQQD